MPLGLITTLASLSVELEECSQNKHEMDRVIRPLPSPRDGACFPVGLVGSLPIPQGLADGSPGRGLS